jgi:hypothetical protein
MAWCSGKAHGQLYLYPTFTWGVSFIKYVVERVMKLLSTCPAVIMPYKRKEKQILNEKSKEVKEETKEGKKENQKSVSNASIWWGGGGTIVFKVTGDEWPNSRASAQRVPQVGQSAAAGAAALHGSTRIACVQVESTSNFNLRGGFPTISYDFSIDLRRCLESTQKLSRTTAHGHIIASFH